MGVLYFAFMGVLYFDFVIYFVLYFDLWVSFIFFLYFIYFALFRLFISSLFREAMKRIAFSFMKPT